MIEYVTFQGERYERVEIPAPAPIPEPQTGTRMKPGDRFVYVIHDNLNPEFNYQARTLGDKIQGSIIGEMYVPRRWYWREDVGEWRVDRFSKIDFWPEELPGDWEQYFFSGMTPRQRELFNVSGFGWRDQKANALITFMVEFVNKVKSWVQDRRA